MATEDYTTYTEVDPNAELTVTAASIVSAAGAADNPDNYVYFDYGVDHFDESAGDILHTFDYSNDGTNNGKPHPWILGNTLNDAEFLKKTALDGYAVEIKFKNNAVEVVLNDYFGEQKTGTKITHANTTTVFGQIDWTSPSSGTLKLSVFTDSGRTTHATNSPQSLTGTSVPCRYHFGLNAANKGGDTYDATSSNIDLNEAGAPAAAVKMEPMRVSRVFP